MAYCAKTEAKCIPAINSMIQKAHEHSVSIFSSLKERSFLMFFVTHRPVRLFIHSAITYGVHVLLF